MLGISTVLDGLIQQPLQQVLEELDGWLRRKLRRILWKQWNLGGMQGPRI